MQEERLAELLERYHSGESNAATSRELECVFSIKGIEVRQMVNRLRRKGIPIASSGSGYFYAATEQEVRATIAHLTRRISGIAAAIAGLNRSLEQFDTAQTRLPLEGGDAVEYDALKLLQTDVLTELVRSKLNVDRLLLRQREGFVSVMPSGWNHFGEQFERVLPASSVANLYPFNYSGKTDPHGFYIGKDKYGANILVDFDIKSS